MAQAPITTIVPFSDLSKLPDCAKECGPLYDANGACVPPAAPPADPAAYTACFCSDSRLAAFSRASTGVCDQACTGLPGGLQSVAGWFQAICKNAKGENGGNGGNGGGNNNQPTTTGTPGSSNNSTGGGDWLSHHWQWVIMLVVLVVAIAVIWIGACIWRRRYLRRKDHQTSLGQKHSGSASNPSWGPAVKGPESATPMTPGRDVERAAYAEKLRKTKGGKKWTVSQRT
ncbi:Uncharacterized protein TCAP_06833 [Tolypocladium capitatum]|uniref:Integral membrane protein n=1 Tax=Tolypocladium capitatum TaxID=45235 RepID=A0A2K3Q6T5_9HYPO|nr:Uncharacterized protein TCAP_06833 [Tolypocladium capitatum]